MIAPRRIFFPSIGMDNVRSITKNVLNLQVYEQWTHPSHSYSSFYQGNHCSALQIGCVDFCPRVSNFLSYDIYFSADQQIFQFELLKNDMMHMMNLSVFQKFTILSRVRAIIYLTSQLVTWLCNFRIIILYIGYSNVNL